MEQRQRGYSEATRGPVWQVAELFPHQGDWSVDAYLELTDHNRLIEYMDGRILFLAWPTMSHQRVLAFLLCAMHNFIEPRRLGEVLQCPLPVRVTDRIFCEPDLVFTRREHMDGRDEYVSRADLVVEVVIEGTRDRDRVDKRSIYAEGGIPEYWIVDLCKERIEVLRLKDEVYVSDGEVKRGERANSVVLEGFGVEVGEVMDEIDGKRWS